MKFTTNYKGFKIVTAITKNSKYSMVIVNGFTRFAGNFIDTINYIDSVTANWKRMKIMVDYSDRISHNRFTS